MAIVLDAGSSAASGPEAEAGKAPPIEIRKIDIADLIECIEHGVRDFSRSSQYGMFFGAFYAVGGIAYYSGLPIPRAISTSPIH